MRHHTLTTCALLALTLTACGTNAEDEKPAADTSPSPTQSSHTGASPSQASPTEDESSSESTSESTSGDTPGVKTMPVFGDPEWSIDVGHRAGISVHGDRILVSGDDKTTAYDPDGKKVWERENPAEGESDGHTDNEQTRVALSPDVMAYTTTGTSDGTGMSTPKPQMQVEVFSLEDGKAIAEHTIDGDSQAPKAEGPGLGITSDTAENFSASDVYAITADGKKHTVEDATKAGTIGNQIIYSDGGMSDSGVFKTDSWSSESFWDDPDMTEASIIGSNNDDLLLAQGDVVDEATYKVVDATSGEVLADADCNFGRTYQDMTSSPNREWNILAGAIIGPDGETTCVGGGEGEKSVQLTAVTDDGTAFGTTETYLGGNQGESVFVQARPGEEPKTEQIEPGTALPLGVVDGDLVLHWNEDTNVLSAHPIND